MPSQIPVPQEIAAEAVLGASRGIAERDQLAVADIYTLRSAGFDVDADHADALAPGPAWKAEVAERQRQERAGLIARTLIQTDAETLAMAQRLLEVARGN